MVTITVNDKSLHEITGFFIRSISGRELYNSEIYETAVRGIDGSFYVDRDIPSRDITVEYEIYAPTPYARVIRYNQLSNLLRESQLKVIFSDEPDKYFIATTAECTGNQIIFRCSDPFKYSTTEREIPANNRKFEFTNQGSAPCAIRYELGFGADNGYIAIVSKDGAMEYGNSSEKDRESTNGKQKVLSWEQFLQAADGGVHPAHNGNGTDYVFNKSTTVKECGPDKPWSDGSYTSKKWLDLGSGSDSGNWISGALKTATVKADVNGEVGAKSWDCTWRSWCQCLNWEEAGEQSISFLASDDSILCRLLIYKDSSSTHMKVDLCMKDAKVVKTLDYDVTQGTPFSHGNQGVITVSKVGERVNFAVDGKNYTFSDPTLVDVVCTKVQAELGKNVNANYLTRNYITDLSFNKRDVQGSVDVENTFPKNCHVTIDGSSGKILVNGQIKTNLEIVGTTYFKSVPGENLIEIGVSSWYSGSLNAKCYLREAWL